MAKRSRRKPAPERKAAIREHKPYVVKDGLVREMADLVLDPMCGSGTSCVVAFKLGRRFLGIDSSADAIGMTHERLKAEGSRHEVWIHPDAPDDWRDGRDRLVLGDTLEVLRTLPECLADLICCDPPFGPGEADRRNFGIVWKWNEDSEAGVERLRAMPDDWFAGDGKEAVLSSLAHLKRFMPDMGAYICWMAEVMVHLRRIAGTEVIRHEPPPAFWTPEPPKVIRSFRDPSG